MGLASAGKVQGIRRGAFWRAEARSEGEQRHIDRGKHADAQRGIALDQHAVPRDLAELWRDRGTNADRTAIDAPHEVGARRNHLAEADLRRGLDLGPGHDVAGSWYIIAAADAGEGTEVNDGEEEAVRLARAGPPAH